MNDYKLYLKSIVHVLHEFVRFHNFHGDVTVVVIIYAVSAQSQAVGDLLLHNLGESAMKAVSSAAQIYTTKYMHLFELFAGEVIGEYRLLGIVS